jgi:endoglucanase
MEELSKQLDDADEEMTGNDAKVLGSGLSEKMTDRGTVMTGAETAGVLMLAYELYPEYFNQFLEGTAGGLRVPAVLETVRSETDWMLTMQDPVSGGVYAGMVKASDQVADTTPETQAETEGSTEVYTAKDVSFRATACYAATLARFSFLYKSYDSTYANKCQKAAEQAWSNLQKTQSGDELDEGAEYYAATELFRLTGLKKYHDVIQDRVLYLSENKNLNEFTFLGDVTYLSTQGKVNKDICNQLISILMKDSESIAENASESLYFVDKDGNGTNSQNILWNMLKMSVVDYVITNHEYSTVIENHVHYLLGANANVTCYMNEFGSRNEGEETDLENQIISLPEKAELMLLLCAVTSQHEMVISS